MKPLAVLNGIVLGSCFAISLGLFVVLFLYGLNADYDYIRDDIPALIGHAIWFTGVALVSAASFWSVVRERWWVWYAQAALVAALGLLVYRYWP